MSNRVRYCPTPSHPTPSIQGVPTGCPESPKVPTSQCLGGSHGHRRHPFYHPTWGSARAQCVTARREDLFFRILQKYS